MLHGRRDECAAIEALLEEIGRSRSGALVLRGEAGVGKSSLLAHAAQQVTQHVTQHVERPHVLRASGVESEVRLPFASLHQLCHPVLDHVDALPAPQAAALRMALGLADGQEDRFLVAVATLTLLAEVAADTGLLCLVDDAQWLDPASAEALTFAARRLDAEGVVMLFAARDDATATFDGAGLPELRIHGLDDKAAGALLVALRPEVDSRVRDRLVTETGGNPLALTELSTLLGEEVMTGRERLTDPLPIGTAMEQLFLQQADELSGAARMLLHYAAAEETGDLGRVLAAAGPAAEAIDEVERSGLVSIVGTALRFRHPLVRSAIYHGAAFTDRQVVHRALASVLDAADPDQADRRAWHLAAAAVTVDDAVADALEASATRARLRGGSAAEAAALERAAALSETPGERGRRLLEAAQAAWLAGQPSWSDRLLHDAEARELQGPLRAGLLHQRGLLELRCGTADRAYGLLMDSARAADNAGAVLDALILAGEAAAAAGDPEWTIAVGALADEVVAVGETQALMVQLLTGAAAMLQGDLTRGADRLGAVVARAERLTDPVQLLWAGRAALYLGDEAAAREVYRDAVERARSGGAVGLLISLLNRIAMSDAIAGRSAEAIANATEGLQLAEETALEADSGIAEFALALAHADRGEEDRCRHHAARAQALAATRRFPMIADGARWSLGRLELGLGRPAEALARLQTPIDVANDRYPMRFLDTADLVESAVRAGQAEACRPQFAAYVAWVEQAARPSQLALTSRCRGLLADGAAALGHFEVALQLHAESEGTFQRARTQLVYGEALRRAKRRRDARPQLRAALEAFERLGAAPWAERARVELRATGVTARTRDPSTIDQLTPQELQIARLAAAGHSNREIAAQLFLSHRTVEYHLHKVFAKLGVTARGQLMRLQPFGGSAQLGG